MDKKLMIAWLQAQAQKQELNTTKIQQKRLGIDLNEQLFAKTRTKSDKLPKNTKPSV